MTMNILYKDGLAGIITVGTYSTDVDPVYDTYHASPNIEVGIITATMFVGDGSGLTGVIGSGSGSGITIKDDDALVGTVSTINFGTNLSVTFSSGISTVNTSDIVTVTTLNDSIGNVRRIPQTSVGVTYTLAVTDVGKHVAITTGGITIPSSIFSIGDNLTIFNNSDYVQMITPGIGVTLRRAGVGDTGSRGLNGYGLATILCISSNNFVITGAGLT